MVQKVNANSGEHGVGHEAAIASYSGRIFTMRSLRDNVDLFQRRIAGHDAK